ncbi:DnaJ domain-containing protein [Ectopseudomonas mendocina]|uniref:DnaJ domain-containing protein n=1 Tax=Ectopseudomonas mendocina TaxID=300 RepID=A0ABZ2RHF3_ECTME
MLWPVTIAGALAGLAVASIPGALLGGLLGQVVDRRLKLDSWAAIRERFFKQPPLDDEWLMFVLLGRLAKSGGRVLPAHIRQARAEMQRLGLDAQGQSKAIAAFNRGKTAVDNLRPALIRQQGRGEVLLQACWRMAWVDGAVGREERELLQLWARWLEVSAAKQNQYKDDAGPKRETVAAAPSTGYQRALALLKVSADDEPAQIKRAYRRLLSQHHPDKLAGSGASEGRIREATEKTRELHQAYDLIRQRHGFR